MIVNYKYVFSFPQESLDSSRRQSLEDTLSPLACDGAMDSKKRSKLLEKEMHEQVKIINDLKALGASHSTIEQEVKRLHELETLIFRGFRRLVNSFCLSKVLSRRISLRSLPVAEI